MAVHELQAPAEDSPSASAVSEAPALTAKTEEESGNSLKRKELDECEVALAKRTRPDTQTETTGLENGNEDDEEEHIAKRPNRAIKKFPPPKLKELLEDMKST